MAFSSGSGDAEVPSSLPQTCYRLYSRTQHDKRMRPSFEPELARCNVETVLLVSDHGLA